MLKYIILIFSLIFIIGFNNAQVFSQSGINIGAKIGGSKLLGEIPFDFTEIINEFDNKTGFASAFEISKYISQYWEIGTEIGYSNLNGNTFTPEFSAEGMHAGIPVEITEPVEYKNKLFSLNFFCRYFFNSPYSESAFVPFISAGGGYLNYNSKFKYIEYEDEKVIFGKGTEGYAKLSTPVFFFGTGLKKTISSNIYLVSSVDFNLVNYDFLDVVHNFSDESNRLEIIGLFTEFKIGIFYNFSKSGDKKNTQNNQDKNKNGSSSNNGYLPFAR